ncbi:hypothetical protein B7463_g6829, partial [Scytalidium lignicola]
MLCTLLASICYLWHNVPEELPFGKKELRPLLFIRGIGGFFSVIGFYCEATVLNFLAPMGACCAMAVISSGTFSLVEITSGILSLTGVVLIAQPEFLFGSQAGVESPGIGATSIVGVGFAIIGAVGGMCSITAIRVIGKRVHPLIGVCYFAATVLLVSAIAFITVPSLKFNLSLFASQWVLLFSMGVIGFLMEFAFAMGLAAETSHRSTYMTYSQAVLAFLADDIVWDFTPSLLSSVGCLWILLALAIETMFSEEIRQIEEEQKSREDESALPLMA